jgi:hypothetical protein
LFAATISAVYLPRKTAAGSDIAQRISRSRCSRTYWPIPIVVLDIDAGVGSNELLDHERVTQVRGPDERRVPAEKDGCRHGYRTAVAVGHIGPYPSLSLTSTPASAAMSCSITLVQPIAAAKISAVYLPRKSAAGPNGE